MTMQINNLHLDIFDIIASFDYMIYRGLLGVYIFGMSTVGNSKKYQSKFRITLRFDIKWNRRIWEQRLPGASKKVETCLSASVYTLNGIKFRYERSDGSYYYYNNKGQYHREDGPAVKIIYKSNMLDLSCNNKDPDKITFEWRINGKLHNPEGPAIETNDGYKEWRINDELHRINGPAIETNTGRREWFQNNKRFREDGPTVETPSRKIWHKFDDYKSRSVIRKIEYSNGTKEWYTYDGSYKHKVEYSDGMVENWLHRYCPFEITMKNGTIVNIIKYSYMNFQHTFDSKDDGKYVIRITSPDKSSKDILIADQSKWKDVYVHLGIKDPNVPSTIWD